MSNHEPSKPDSGSDLFAKERATLEQAQTALKGELSATELQDQLQTLTKSYRKLLRQTERLTRISDRRQNKYYSVSNELDHHLARHVGEAIKDEILRAPTEVETIHKRQLVIAFIDVRGFSTFSEGLSPDAVITFLKHYYDYSLRIVHRHGGLVKCFMGDGVMLVFGFRRPETAADRALRCGAEILEELPAFRETVGLPVRVGIGLHHGETAVGTIGTDRRAELAIIGNTVNMAARIESETKSQGVPLLFSNAFRDQLKENWPLHTVGEVMLRGLRSPTTLFTLGHLMGSASGAAAGAS
ncbi:adenylate/guanylate cyclase domain-containing protein [Acanthopleuribacter pedis]|uniref:Adenylate/guanylate cyclase domain-containing protein n=1 Tax=Acanthopleuribacter pedis TaxID=442870 RepID=A0A8J7QD11_9BACT|nr:adenylate/guanylate cyclase domain-containing protein [Acanthopleuribacter pedis]MBO1317330.1 adenylate/guanylate cyclase domain-containing protein [Acanthopleuribacter pedis]MBO1318637.1 adenylate/guanylate cyclase domain-containing protein [Acanthopleuribacter pedis]